VDTSSFGKEGSPTPKARAVPYPAEFRQKIVDLVRAGRSPAELAEQLEPSEQTIRNWVAQADANEGKRKDVLSSVEREELVKLRRENKQLKAEREILAKATAWFAREADTKPKKSFPHSSLDDRTPDEAYFGMHQLKRRHNEHRVITASRARVRGMRHARAAVDNPPTRRIAPKKSLGAV
jgi:transposase